MTKSPPKVVIPLQPLDIEARDGKYQFLADDKLFALGRWNERDLCWTYPGGALLDFEPRYYRPASKAVQPLSEVDRG